MTGPLPLKAAERHKLRRASFDTDPALYERARPGYPEPLFDDLVRLGRIPVGGRIIEIGPGTGQATLPLARRGFGILAVERSPRMARRCRANLRPFPGVEVLATSFEDWPVEEAAFDVVFAAAAFHWLPARTAYPKAARALRPKGCLALAWNFRDEPHDAIRRELDELYVKLGFKPWRARTPEERTRRQREAILNSGRFGPVRITRHPWSRDYDADSYIALLKTMSDHAIQPGPVRRRLFTGIRRIFARHGGKLTRDHVATLLVAPLRRRSPTA